MTHENLLPPDPWQPPRTIGFYDHPVGTWAYLHSSLGAKPVSALTNDQMTNILVGLGRGLIHPWFPPQALLQSQSPPVDEEG